MQGLEQPVRLDRAIRQLFPKWGRKAVQSLINAGKVKVDGREVWLCSWQVNNGDQLEIFAVPREKPQPPIVFDDSWIISEENDLIVVDKPAGLLSHSTRWTKTENLLDLAINRFGTVSLFHRLDRDTSGVVLLTRQGSINRYLDTSFKEGKVQREYIAIIPAKNNLLAEGSITTRIGPHPQRRDMMKVVKRGGKYAVTHYQIVGESDGEQLIYLWPETGRTHQLRVHLAHMGVPIVGDRLYGTQYRDIERLMLHARQISLPESDEFPARSYSALIPEEFSIWMYDSHEKRG